MGQAMMARGGSNGGGGMTLLWTNPTPTAAFNAQNITVEGLSDYEGIGILTELAPTTFNTYYFPMQVFRNVSGITHCMNGGFNEFRYSRRFQVSGNVLSFTEGVRDANDTSLDWMTPLYVYGVKMG